MSMELDLNLLLKWNKNLKYSYNVYVLQGEMQNQSQNNSLLKTH